jgi:POT family proton-dependent oligopeptide transporter
LSRSAPARGGFTLFYLGINLGRFIGPLITGLLQTHAGFHYGFGAAAVGMALGLAQYVVFRRNLGEHGRTVPNPLPRSAIGWAVGTFVVVVIVIVLAFVTGLVKLANLSQVTTGVIVAASVAYFIVMLTSSKVVALERTRLDHRALTAFRDHVDAAGQSRTDHTAQVRLRCDRHGTGFSVVPANVGNDG